MLEDQGILPPKKKDWMHLNAIHYDKASETIVGRNQRGLCRLRHGSLGVEPRRLADRAAAAFESAARLSAGSTMSNSRATVCASLTTPCW